MPPRVPMPALFVHYVDRVDCACTALQMISISSYFQALLLLLRNDCGKSMHARAVLISHRFEERYYFIVLAGAGSLIFSSGAAAAAALRQNRPEASQGS